VYSVSEVRVSLHLTNSDALCFQKWSFTIKMENELPGFFNDVSLGIVLIDNSFNIKDINNSFCFLLQKQKEYLQNKDLSWFIPPIKSFALNKNHEFQVCTLDNGQALAIDIMRLKKTKDTDYLIFCQDQTQYHQLLEQIKQLNQKNIIYEKMFNVLYDGIYITDGNGVALYVNDAFLNLSGLQKEDIIGKSVYQQMDEGLLPNSCAAIVLRTKKPASTLNKYTQGRNCLVTGTPVFVDEELQRVICIVHDVTELQAMEERMAKATSLSSSLKQHLREIEVKTENKFVLETRSKIMKSIYDKAATIAALDTPVLILGETGVGKDFLVKFIHHLPARKDEGVLMKINCGAIPENLLESELFGYEPGAFTGASRQGKVGLFELATKGTLYLDEIGDMPLSLQVKFLDVLQEKTFYRLGGTKSISLGARIIAATNVDLEKAIAAGKFRRDLYYRLNVISINLPPLRQRIDDIIPLSVLFLERYNKKYDKSRYFAPQTVELLLNYDWPGNVRELENIIERLVIITPADCIEPRLFLEQVTSAEDQFKIYIQGRGESSGLQPSMKNQSLKEAVGAYEESFIRDTLKKHANLRESAQALGIDLSTLVRKKQKFKI
jgi:PAS domain S-box-containing protein